jgi:hypothetical protein
MTMVGKPRISKDNIRLDPRELWFKTEIIRTVWKIKEWGAIFDQGPMTAVKGRHTSGLMRDTVY